MPSWAMWVTGVCLIFFRALLGAAESALHGLSDVRAKELVSAEPRRAPRLVRLKTEREATAAAIRFGMVLSGFVAAAIGTLLLPNIIGASAQLLGESAWVAWAMPLVSALIIAALASLLEVSVRAWASNQPESWALRLAGLTTVVVTLLYPIMRLLVAPLNLLLSLWGTQVRFVSPPPPLEEIEKLIAAQAENQELDKGAPQLIRSIFELSDKTCRDVMVPRTEMIGVEISTPVPQILRVVAEEGHSRMPVYKDDVDQIVGILNVRDLVPLMQHPELIVLADIVRPAVYVPWVKSIGDLLREMQKQRIHMALVVDEYGGVMGLVTLEDLLSEIVGEIHDEFEEEERSYERQTDGSFIIDGTLSPEEFRKHFECDLPAGEYETMGGMLSSIAGCIPEKGERFSVNGCVFIVQAKEGPKLTKIRVVRPKEKKVAPVPAA